MTLLIMVLLTGVQNKIGGRRLGIGQSFVTSWGLLVAGLLHQHNSLEKKNKTTKRKKNHQAHKSQLESI
jgi:hypothetical protein